MSNLYWLSDGQMERLKPFFPKSHGKPRVDDRCVLSGIIFINRNGLRWCDAPKEYGPHKTLYNRWKRWSDNGVFARIHDRPGRHERRAQDDHDRRDLPQGTPHGVEPVREKGGRGRQIGRTKVGMNTKLHAVADAKGRPIGFFMSAGQVSDYTGAAALLGSLPKVRWLLADKDYDTLKDKGVKVCIPRRISHKKAVKFDKRRYNRRNRFEIMFGRLKDWRRVATRYDRCPETFFSAAMLAATVIFWL